MLWIKFINGFVELLSGEYHRTHLMMSQPATMMSQAAHIIFWYTVYMLQQFIMISSICVLIRVAGRIVLIETCE